MRPQVIIMIQKFLDILPQKVLILIQNVNDFFRLNNSREEELAVGMKEVQATAIATKTATTITITKKNIIIISIIMTAFKNNPNNDNNKT